MLSLEAAWLYAIADASANDDLYLQGEVQMKGVWKGKGYPLFWLDTQHQHAGQGTLDRILGMRPADSHDVCELAEALCTRDPDWPTKIYLPDSKKPALKQHHAVVKAEVERLREVEDTQAVVPVLPEDDSPPTEPASPP